MKTILKTLLLAPMLLAISVTPATAGNPVQPPRPVINKATPDDVLAVCRQYLIEADKHGDKGWLERFLNSLPFEERLKNDIRSLCTFHHQGAHDMLTLKMLRT